MDPQIEDKLRGARELFATVKHGAMATVNEDGTPHNTPYFVMFSADLATLYWASHPQSQHSVNIARTGRLFVVLFDPYNVRRGGVYIEAEDGHILRDAELEPALAIYNAHRARQGKLPILPSYYTGDSEQKMYGAKAKRFWLNMADRGMDGWIIRDYRHEIQREDLLRHEADTGEPPAGEARDQ